MCDRADCICVLCFGEEKEIENLRMADGCPEVFYKRVK